MASPRYVTEESYRAVGLNPSDYGIGGCSHGFLNRSYCSTCFDEDRVRGVEEVRADLDAMKDQLDFYKRERAQLAEENASLRSLLSAPRRRETQRKIVSKRHR